MQQLLLFVKDIFFRRQDNQTGTAKAQDRPHGIAHPQAQSCNLAKHYDMKGCAACNTDRLDSPMNSFVGKLTALCMCCFCMLVALFRICSVLQKLSDLLKLSIIHSTSQLRQLLAIDLRAQPTSYVNDIRECFTVVVNAPKLSYALTSALVNVCRHSFAQDITAVISSSLG